MYIMNDIKLAIILVLSLVIVVMLFLTIKKDREVDKKVVYVQNNPFPVWYYRTGPIWRPPFRRRRFR